MGYISERATGPRSVTGVAGDMSGKPTNVPASCRGLSDDQPSGMTVMASITPALLMLLAFLVDVTMLLIGSIVTTKITRHLGFHGMSGDLVLVEVVAVFVTLFMLIQLCAYVRNALGSVRSRLQHLTKAMLSGGLTGALGLTAIHGLSAAAVVWAVLWMAVTGLLVAIGMIGSAGLFRFIPATQRLVPRVAVVGASPFSQAFIERMVVGTPSVVFVGLYDDECENEGQGLVNQPSSDLPTVGFLKDLVLRGQKERIDAVVLATPSTHMARIASVRSALCSMTADIFLATEAIDLVCTTSRIERLGPNLVVKIVRRPLSDWQVLQKTMLDLVLGAILFVLLLPLMVTIGIAVRLDSPGPALFQQYRRGYNNSSFKMFKFRTMYEHMSDANADRQTTRGDPRVTRIGRFLRRTSLDELPQLLNVLHSEMSLVGPRPHAINTKAGDVLFPDAVADYMLRYRVKPGITGWAQVNGWRGETCTVEQIKGRVLHDLHYIENWSLILDLKIIALTILRELNSKVAF